MNNYITKGTNRTLDINFNAQTGILNLQGSSYSENAIEFFTPLIEWVSEYERQPQPKTTVNFTIEYAATSSVKYILEFLKAVEELSENGKTTVEVNWHYFEVDEDIYELGVDYDAIVDIPFNFVALNLLPDLEILKQLKYETGKEFLNCEDLDELNITEQNAYVLNEKKEVIGLALHNNSLRFFPLEIFELKKLQVLILSKNQLKKIPKDIKGLTSLYKIKFLNNRIKDLPKELFEMKIDWKNNCEIDEPFLKSPPPEIIEQGKHAIDNYFNQL